MLERGKRIERHVKELEKHHAMFGPWRLRAQELGNSIQRLPLREVGIRLLGIIADRAVAGELAVLQGDVGGWHDIFLASQYRYWRIRIAPRTPLLASFEEASRAMLHALAFGQWSIASDIYDVIQGARDAEAAGRGVFYDRFGQSPIVALPLGLWLLRQGLMPMSALHALWMTNFSHLALAWGSARELSEEPPEAPPNDFAGALERLCDQHLKWSADDDNGVFFRGERLLAPEIHALRSVRNELGMVTPLIHHPLLHTELATMPPGEVLGGPGGVAESTFSLDDPLLTHLTART